MRYRRARPGHRVQPRCRRHRRARRHRGLSALPARRAGGHRDRRGREGSPAAARSGRPRTRAGLQDDRRPVRRPAHVLTGSTRARIKSHDHVWNANRGEDERIGQVLRIHGKEQEAVGEIRAGEIGAVAKLVYTLTGDTISDAGRLRSRFLPSTSRLRRCRSQSNRPPRRTSTSSARPCTRLLEEDPTIKVERQTETGEQLLWGQGENQIAVAGRAAQAQVRDVRHHARAARALPRDDPQQDPGGGAAQEADRRPRPVRPRVAGDRAEPGRRRRVRRACRRRRRCRGSSSPGVEKGVRDVAEKGPIAGYPVIDFKATLYDGSFHTVDSDELSFRLAGSLATRKGIQDANPVLLEPIMDVEVRVPEAYMGDVNRDLNTRRGRVQGMDTADGLQSRPRTGPAVGTVHVRDGASIADRRTRHVQCHARPLRGSAAARGPEDHRRAQEGRGGQGLRFRLAGRRPVAAGQAPRPAATPKDLSSKPYTSVLRGRPSRGGAGAWLAQSAERCPSDALWCPSPNPARSGEPGSATRPREPTRRSVRRGW